MPDAEFFGVHAKVEDTEFALCISGMKVKLISDDGNE
jgi:hypothetical protein